MKLLPIAALVGLAIAANQASAGEFTRAICGEPDSLLIVSAPAEREKDVAPVIQTLPREVCAQRGAINGAWVLQGTPKAMQIGLIPAGPDGAPHLQVWAPRFQLIGPLKVEVIKTEAVVSNNN